MTRTLHDLLQRSTDWTAKPLGKWMTIEPVLPQPNRKTNMWIVRSQSDGAPLGAILWYTAWRQYCFEPERNTVFSEECLNDITNALDRANAQHKTDLQNKARVRRLP